jgi:hypothetical protein
MPPTTPTPVPADKFTVQRWSQYKLGRAPMAHDRSADKHFPTQAAAQLYADTADSGISGDTRYRYKVVERELKIDKPSNAGKRTPSFDR